MSHPKKLTYAALAATLTLLLGACGQTEVAAANSPTPTLTAVRSTGTAPIPFDTFGRTPAGSRQTFQAQAAAQDIARIQIFPPTASLADGGTATFYAEAFDAAGRSLGNIDYADLTVSQVAPQTGAVIESGSTSTGFRVTVPAGQYDNRTLVVALKDQPTIRSQIDLATVALQPGVINLSDGNIQFPKVTTDYSQATEAQVAAELAPFTLSEYIGAFPAQANQLNSPFVLQSSVPLHVGDLIHISHSGSTFGRIATVQVKGDLYLVSLELAPASTIIKDFNKYLDTTTASEGASPQPSNLSAQQIKSECIGEARVNMGKLELKHVDLASSKVEIEFNAGFGVDLNTEARLECSRESRPIYTNTGPFVSLGFSGRVYASLVSEGTIDASLNNNLKAYANLFDPLSALTVYSVDLSDKFIGSGIDSFPMSSKFTGEFGVMGRVHVVPLNGLFQAKVYEIWRRFYGGQSGNYTLFEFYLDLGVPVVAEAEILNERSAFDKDKGSSIEAKGLIKSEIGMSGAMVDLINAWGLNLPIASEEWTLFKKSSETPEITVKKIIDYAGMANIQLDSGATGSVDKVILGDKNHNTLNSLHKDQLGKTGGWVDYDTGQCDQGKIEAKILGYGGLLWDKKPIPLINGIPFGTRQIVKVCSLPKISDIADMTIIGRIGKYAEGQLAFQNVGDEDSILDYLISSNGIKFDPERGNLKYNETQVVKISQYCSSKDDSKTYVITVKNMNSNGRDIKNVNVKVKCLEEVESYWANPLALRFRQPYPSNPPSGQCNYYDWVIFNSDESFKKYFTFTTPADPYVPVEKANAFEVCPDGWSSQELSSYHELMAKTTFFRVAMSLVNKHLRPGYIAVPRGNGPYYGVWSDFGIIIYKDN